MGVVCPESINAAMKPEGPLRSFPGEAVGRSCFLKQGSRSRAGQELQGGVCLSGAALDRGAEHPSFSGLVHTLQWGQWRGNRCGGEKERVCLPAEGFFKGSSTPMGQT